MITEVTHNNLPEAVAEILQWMRSVDPKLISVSQEMGREDLDIEEAAKLLNKSKSTIYSYVSKNAIPYYKQGATLWFKKSELMEWKMQPKPKDTRMEELEMKRLKKSRVK
ncbi:MAG: helix-turn-helix domain-containing protein [Taibaiella sp.]|nr:helix-turn-helix domain-containing protein [Taibaiella sp.]